MNKNVKRRLWPQPFLTQAAPFVQHLTVKADTFRHTEEDGFFFTLQVSGGPLETFLTRS